MNTAAASSTRFEGSARSDDRWLLTLPRRGLTLPSSSIALASIAVHAVLVVIAVATSRPTEVPKPQEIVVEVVKDVPKPASEKVAETPKPSEKPPPQTRQEKPREVQKGQAAKPSPPPPRDAQDELRRQVASLKAERAALERRAAAKAAQDSKPSRPVDPIAKKYRDLLGSPMPGMAAVALPGTSALGSDAVAYPQLVLSKLAKAKKEGRYQGIPGAATVSFTVGDNGEVAVIDVARKSVDPKLDEEAIAMVKRGAPYPPPPLGGQRDYVITLRFQALP